MTAIEMKNLNTETHTSVEQGMKKVAAPAATLPARKQAFMFFGR